MPRNLQSQLLGTRCFTLITFILGICGGIHIHSLYSTCKSGLHIQSNNYDANQGIKDTGPSHGTVSQLSATPIRNTVHIDSQGRPITKQQMIEPFLIPNLVGVSVATFLPGQTMMPPHEHESMHEIFFVLEGKGAFEIDGVQHEVSPGTLLHLAPGEAHGIWVLEAGADGPLKMLVTGVAVGEKKEVVHGKETETEKQ